VDVGRWRFWTVDSDSEVIKTIGLVSLVLFAVWLYRSKRPSTHFSLAELTVTETGLSNVPNAMARENLERLASEVLEPLRARFGPIVVNSAYRSPAVNAAVSGSSSSRHMLGQASDIYAQDGTPPSTLAAWLYDQANLPLDQVIIYWNNGYLHVAMDPNGAPFRRDFLQTFDGKSYEAWTPTGRVT